MEECMSNLETTNSKVREHREKFGYPGNKGEHDSEGTWEGQTWSAREPEHPDGTVWKNGSSWQNEGTLEEPEVVYVKYDGPSVMKKPEEVKSPDESRPRCEIRRNPNF